MGSPLQAKFLGPYSVVKKVSEQDYVISTPNRKKSTQLCHVNLLKLYHSRDLLVGTEFQNQKSEMGSLVLSVGAGFGHAESDTLLDTPSLDDPVVCGQLKNSENLKNLDTLLGHLNFSEKKEIADVINSYPSLFGDTPSRTHLLVHDIDVGDSQPIRQHFYRVSPNKRKVLDAEVGYMLQNDIAVPSSSSWASPSLLVEKSDKTPCFCTDYRKINAITKPDSFPLQRMEDCVDQVGSARFVSKFDLLKGYWQVPLSSRAREISAFVTPSGLY